MGDFSSSKISLGHLDHSQSTISETTELIYEFFCCSISMGASFIYSFSLLILISDSIILEFVWITKVAQS